MDQIISVLSNIINQIPGGEWSALGVLAIGVEFIFRFFKTGKPLSIAWVVAGITHKVSSLLNLLATGIEKIAVLMDKLLPQQLKK